MEWKGKRLGGCGVEVTGKSRPSSSPLPVHSHLLSAVNMCAYSTQSDPSSSLASLFLWPSVRIRPPPSFLSPFPFPPRPHGPRATQPPIAPGHRYGRPPSKHAHLHHARFNCDKPRRTKPILKKERHGAIVRRTISTWRGTSIGAGCAAGGHIGRAGGDEGALARPPQVPHQPPPQPTAHLRHPTPHRTPLRRQLRHRSPNHPPSSSMPRVSEGGCFEGSRRC